jgi:thioredoxin-like negative regulator of GroEL
MFKPAYEQFAEAYVEKATFVTITGDANTSTAALMKRLSVKSVPAFFLYKDGAQVSAWTGANKQGFRNQLAQFIPL